eukprot:3841373-Prymnesium_polylepis.2
MMLDYVRKRRPCAVVLENVASLLSPHRRHAFDRVCAMLLAIHGYTWYVGVLCPGDHGGAARRARVYWVGVRA